MLLLKEECVLYNNFISELQYKDNFLLVCVCARVIAKMTVIFPLLKSFNDKLGFAVIILSTVPGFHVSV